MRRFLCTLALVCLGLAQPASAATILFSDTEFANVDSQVITATAFSGFVADQLPTGGNPDSYLRVNLSTTAGGDNIWVFHALDGMLYDPSTQGAIQDLTGGMDGALLAALPGQTQAAGLAFRQDGHVFLHGGSVGQLGVWERIHFENVVGLGSPTPCLQFYLDIGFTCEPIDATHFFSHTAPGGPDFSASGSPIEWGFFTANSGGIFDITGGYDNFSLTLNTVPEPATLLLFASGALAFGLRRCLH